MRVKEETVAASTSNLMKYDCEVLFATVNLPFRKSCFAPSSKETSSQTIVTKKKAAHFFVIHNGDPSSNSHDSHHLLQEKRSQDDLGCSMNVFYGFPSFPACGMTPPEVLDLRGDESWDAERLALGMFFYLGASCMKI